MIHAKSPDYRKQVSLQLLLRCLTRIPTHSVIDVEIVGQGISSRWDSLIVRYKNGVIQISEIRQSQRCVGALNVRHLGDYASRCAGITKQYNGKERKTDRQERAYTGGDKKNDISSSFTLD